MVNSGGGGGELCRRPEFQGRRQSNWKPPKKLGSFSPKNASSLQFNLIFNSGGDINFKFDKATNQQKNKRKINHFFAHTPITNHPDFQSVHRHKALKPRPAKLIWLDPN